MMRGMKLPEPAHDADTALASIDHNRVWRNGKLTEVDLPPSELIKLAKHAADGTDALVWIDLVRPTPEALSVVVEHMGLPQTAVEDALAPHERAKMIRHDSHVFFTVYTARLSARAPREERLSFSRVSGIVQSSTLVTIRLDDHVSLDELTSRWDQDPGLLSEGTSALVYGLLDYVVDTHFDTIQHLDDEMERLEDALFERRATGSTFQRDLFALRKELVHLRRVVLPMREIVSGILHTPDRGALDPWYDDLYDHVLRAMEWTDSLRDLLNSVFETNLSLQDARLNTIMRSLAAWAAIIAVPTLITGWFGQNIPYPGFGEPIGLMLSVAFIAISIVGLFFAFKKRDWL